jgi:hypothetical protein
MTSNELALRPSAEVANRTDESPCPKFDRAVYSALINVHATAIDPEVPPHEREAARTVQEGALRRLVEKVETGKWDERIPEPVREAGFTDLHFAEPQPPSIEILALIDDPKAFEAYWDQLTWAQKTRWAEDRVPRR